MNFIRLGAGGGRREEEDDEDAGEEQMLLASPGTSSSSEAEEEEEEEEEEEGRRVQPSSSSQFDVSLPARHLYLGEMEEEGQAAMEDEETTPILPLLCLPHRVLFPGETLPMHIYRSHTIQLLRDAATRQKPVAIVTDFRTNPQLRGMIRPKMEDVSKLGTTAEILGMREEDEEDQTYWAPCLIVKFLGRQRFKLLEIFKRPDGEMDGRVAILPEISLPPRPLLLAPTPPCLHAGAMASRLATRAGSTSTFTQRQNSKHYKTFQDPHLSSSLCQVPSWVFTLYDQDYLRQKILEEEMVMVPDPNDPEEQVQARLPEDVVSLSYWLARRLPVSDKEKITLLSIHCPTLRLIHSLRQVQELTDLCCTSCGKVITMKTHLFSMSVDGPVASYVNPGGHVHDTLTAKEAENVRTHGPSSTDHSWFPGYSWTCLSCKGCTRHMGWLFQATKRGLDPPKFFGLCRKNLEHKPSGSGRDKGQPERVRSQPCSPS